MHNSNGGISHGTSGSPQQAIEQEEYASIVANIEDNTKKEYEMYLRETLPQSSPISIPNNATIKEEQKNGYSQVKYTWEKGGYKYTSRWHTRTPNAPKDEGDTWVVERRRPGIGAGPNARRARSDILVGKENGKYKWISKKVWQDAIRARKNGTATKEQKEILKNGHWKA